MSTVVFSQMKASAYAIPKSALIYFCIAVVGAPVLTAIEVVTRIPPTILDPTPVEYPKPLPAADDTDFGQAWARATTSNNELNHAIGKAGARQTDQPIKSIFASLSGSWSGDGRMISGLFNEKIRCRAVFKAAAQTPAGTLFCAGDSYRFELQSTDLVAPARLTRQDKPFGSTVKFEGTVEGQLVGLASPLLTKKAEGRPISVELIPGGSSPTLAIRTSVDQQNKAEIRLQRSQSEESPAAPPAALP